MALNVGREVSAMQRMTVTQLREKYEEVFGEACRSNHKQWLVKRIAWRMQANEEGDLSERARKRAAELANDADLRMKAQPQKRQSAAPRGRKVQAAIGRRHDDRIPMPGTVLTREYKGETVQVTVMPEGFEHAGKVYPSLSAVAKAITGSHTSGFLFFRLNRKGGRKRRNAPSMMKRRPSDARSTRGNQQTKGSTRNSIASMPSASRVNTISVLRRDRVGPAFPRGTTMADSLAGI